jgi:hypothetical protein
VDVTDDADGDGGATDDEEALSGLANATGALAVLAATDAPTVLAAGAERSAAGIGGALGRGGGSAAACVM